MQVRFIGDDGGRGRRESTPTGVDIGGGQYRRGPLSLGGGGGLRSTGGGGGGGGRCAEVNGVHIDVLSLFQRTTIPCFFPTHLYTDTG